MLLLQILQLIIGTAFLLFIPGFLLTKVLFKKQDILERIALSIGISICIDVILGMIFGFNESVANITGGLTKTSLWLSLLVISAALLFIYLWKNKK